MFNKSTKRISLVIAMFVLILSVVGVSASWIYAVKPIEPVVEKIEIDIFPWEGSDILPDDVIGQNHSALIANMLNGTMTDSNGNQINIGINNPNSELSTQIDNRLDRNKYTFGSMDVWDSEQMNSIFGLEAAELTFMIYSPRDNTSVKYLYTTGCDLGETGTLWWSNENYPIGERIYPIYRTRLELEEYADGSTEWIAVKTVLGSANSAFYDNDYFGSSISKNPAFDPLTFAPYYSEDCESGETAIAVGSTVSNAIYTYSGQSVSVGKNSADETTYFKFPVSSAGTATITRGENSTHLLLEVYSDVGLNNLVATNQGNTLSFSAQRNTTYYIKATGDVTVEFVIS